MTNLASLSPTPAATGASAPSIDFVTRNDPGAFSSVSCDARQIQSGDTYSAAGQPRNNKGYSVPLDQLLGGADGAYQVSCTAQSARTGDSYRTEMEAAKFTQGEPGTSAPTYQDGKGYGVNAAPSARLGTCWRPDTQTYDESCLTQHYGNKSHYLEQVESERDVQWGQRKFASAVGVSLEPNPRGPSL